MERIRPKWLKSTKGIAFTGIGPLEADILAIIWERHQATTVRDVYETLREQRPIAYTTVMTVMNNLVKKDLLTQDRTAIAYVYTPAIPGNEVASTILDSVVQRLFRGRSNLALSHLLGLERDLNPEQSEELRKYAEEHFVA
jgi:predicted transcriptional regulator